MGEVASMKLCIRIVPNEHGGYTGVCPSLPGCQSYGTTRQQAREKLDEAIRGYIAAVSDFVPAHIEREVVES